MYSRGLPSLNSVREDAPNSGETWGPREWGGLIWWGWGGDILLAGRCGMWNSQKVGWEGYKVWTVKKKRLKNKNK